MDAVFLPSHFSSSLPQPQSPALSDQILTISQSYFTAVPSSNPASTFLLHFQVSERRFEAMFERRIWRKKLYKERGRSLQTLFRPYILNVSRESRKHLPAILFFFFMEKHNFAELSSFLCPGSTLILDSQS